MPNMRQVAKKAGVHVSTVSRALSGKVAVDPKTATKINKAIASLSYEPNALAQSLALGKSGVMGIMTRKTMEGDFFWGLFRGIEKKLSSAKYHPLVLTSKDLTETLVLIRQKKIDGLIVLLSGEMESGPVIPWEKIGRDFPMVSVNRSFAGIPSVRSDYAGGVSELGQIIKEKSPSNIHLVGSPDTNTTHAELKKGLMSLTGPDIHYSEAGESDEALEKIIGQVKAGTLIFFARPRVLIRFYLAVKKIRPGLFPECRLACLDGLEGMALMESKVWIVSQQLEILGERAAEILLDRTMGEKPPRPALHDLIPTRIREN